MEKKLIILALLAVLLLSSCTIMIKPDMKTKYNTSKCMASKYHKGMSYDNVLEIISSYLPKEKYKLELQDEAAKQTRDISNVFPNTKILILEHGLAATQGIYYVYTFENDKLVYWDTAMDYGKTGNEKLIKIGNIATEIIIKELGIRGKA